MRLSTFLKFLVVILVGLWVSSITYQNADLLRSPFLVFGETRYLPLWAFFLLVFFAGLLPPTVALLGARLERWQEERRHEDRGRARAEIDQLLLEARESQLSGRTKETRRAFDRILARRPDDVTTLLEAGAFLRETGLIEEALALHERARALAPRSTAPLFELARDHQARKDGPAAVGALSETARLDPNGAIEAVRGLRDLAVARSDWEAALQWKRELDRRLALAPESTRAGDAAIGLGIEYERAVQLGNGGRIKDATAMLETLVKREPRFLPASLALGRLLAANGDESGALEIYRDGFERTGSPIFLQALEDHHIEREAPIRALEELKATVAKSDHDVLPRFALGRLYYRLEMPDEALRELNAILPRVARSSTLHFILARIHERRGRLREAAEFYRTSIRNLGASKNDFLCSNCRERFPAWQGRCDKCGAWSSIQVDFEEQQTSSEDLGVFTTTVWGAAASDFDDTFPPIGDEPPESE